MYSLLAKSAIFKDLFEDVETHSFSIQTLISQIHKSNWPDGMGHWLLQFPEHWAVTLLIKGARASKQAAVFRSHWCLLQQLPSPRRLHQLEGIPCSFILSTTSAAHEAPRGRAFRANLTCWKPQCETCHKAPALLT